MTKIIIVNNGITIDNTPLMERIGDSAERWIFDSDIKRIEFTGGTDTEAWFSTADSKKDAIVKFVCDDPEWKILGTDVSRYTVSIVIGKPAEATPVSADRVKVGNMHDLVAAS